MTSLRLFVFPLLANYVEITLDEEAPAAAAALPEDGAAMEAAVEALLDADDGACMLTPDAPTEEELDDEGEEDADEGEEDLDAPTEGMDDEDEEEDEDEESSGAPHVREAAPAEDEEDVEDFEEGSGEEEAVLPPVNKKPAANKAAAKPKAAKAKAKAIVEHNETS